MVVLAAGVGVAAGAWAFSGVASCTPPGRAIPVDHLCFQLVRTMSERVGVLAAVATVIVVLMMVGLSRMAAGPERRSD